MTVVLKSCEELFAVCSEKLTNRKQLLQTTLFEIS